MFGSRTLNTYKAEAIQYRMCFGKAHEYQTDWLREYFRKEKPLPEDIVSRESSDESLRGKLQVIDRYEAWARSDDRIDGIPVEFRELIIKTFGLD